MAGDEFPDKTRHLARRGQPIGGTGRPVVDALRREGLNPVPVSITAGRRTRQVNGMVYLPKRELVRGLVSATETGRLRIAKGLPLAGALVRELQAFRVRLTAKGRDTYAAHSGGTTTWCWRSR